MKMVKSLLLGSAAGLVAVAGAQAADLPVKAKPVQYVKICSLYGVGFYYIPGTDMCIKIGGWVRAEAAWSTNGSSTSTLRRRQLNNRSTNELWWRIRGYITADARNQTEYGTVRGYIAIGLSTNTIAATRDEPSTPTAPSFSGRASPSVARSRSSTSSRKRRSDISGFTPNSDTGDGGKDVMAIRRSSATGSRPRSRPKVAARRRSSMSARSAAHFHAAWSVAAASRQPAAPSRASAATAAGRFRTSSATCALTRLGVLRRSAAPCTRSTAHTMRTPPALVSHQASKATAIRATSGATPLWPASS